MSVLVRKIGCCNQVGAHCGGFEPVHRSSRDEFLKYRYSSGKLTAQEKAGAHRRVFGPAHRVFGSFARDEFLRFRDSSEKLAPQKRQLRTLNILNQSTVPLATIFCNVVTGQKVSPSEKKGAHCGVFGLAHRVFGPFARDEFLQYRDLSEKLPPQERQLRTVEVLNQSTVLHSTSF
jgi:predicted nucleotidyltransferase